MISITQDHLQLAWQGQPASLALDEASIQQALRQLDRPLYFLGHQGALAASNQGQLVSQGATAEAAYAFAPSLQATDLGDASFKAFHGVSYAYYGGSMANGISSEAMVIALGQQGFLASFGAAGLVPARINQAIDRIQAALPQGPYAFNLIHSPSEEALEREAVSLFLQRGVKTVEASAYLGLTEHIVRFRVAGLARDAQGQVIATNKILAKISRKEVATRFMQPAPANFVQSLLQKGLITPEQADMAKTVPMADDIIVEADSGGHTDNRPFLALLPVIIELRNQIQAQYQYPTPIRVGAGGGIGSPEAALAAFAMGAAFVVTGTINQACKESGTSDHVRKLLAQADMADVMMAPASDMFEMGVKLQVLKRGTFFPMRALKLWEIYASHNSIEEIDPAERQKLETQVFKAPLDEIWKLCVTFFNERDPETIKKCENNPKQKMAIIFRWYLGLSSRWANANEKGREMDYQIWCGPAIGAFNDWTKGTPYELPENRQVAHIAQQLLTQTAYLTRLNLLKAQGIVFSPDYYAAKPQ